MGTVADLSGLNQKFDENVKNAIESTFHTNQHQHAVIRKKLLELNKPIHENINALAQHYAQVLHEIIEPLNKQIPDQDQLKRIKDVFKKHHSEFKKQLEKIHEEQYDQFELAIEDNHAVPAERFILLEKLKNAQQAQLSALDNQAAYDQKRLDNHTPANLEKQRDQKFSAYVLSLAQQGKAISRNYRPSIFSTIKKLTMDEEEREKYDVPGEVEIKRAATFSAKDLVQDNSDPHNPQWRAKTVLEEEEKKKATGTIGVRAKGASEWGGDWITLAEDGDYLRGQKEIRLDDVPAAGIFKHILPLRALEGIIFDKPELVIKIGVSVKADKKKGIPATDNAITCEVEFYANGEERADILNIVMHTARAKGWEDIDVGYDTDENMWDQAYLAARRVGFTHDEIFFRGKLMNNESLKLKGDKEREKITNAFAAKEQKDKAAQVTQAAQEGKQPRGMDDVIRKLTGIIPYHPNLDPTRFFAFDQKSTDQKQLFSQGNLNQQAKIMADYAFNEELLVEEYMNLIVSQIPEDQTPVMLAELLDQVAIDNQNPQRALSIFYSVKNTLQPMVFEKVDSKTAACMLMHMSTQEGDKLFKKAGSTNANRLNQQVQILKEPGLSDVAIFRLYQTFDQPGKRQVIDSLAKNVDKHSLRVLGVIVAHVFVNNLDKTDAVIMFLKNILKKLPKDSQKEQVVEHVYQALPKLMRMPPAHGAADTSFFTCLQQYEKQHNDSSTSAIRKFYKQAGKKFANQEKISDELINNYLDSLSALSDESSSDENNEESSSDENDDENEIKTKLDQLYAHTTPADIARCLMEFADDSKLENRVYQLNMLINHTELKNHSQLVEIIEQLGPPVLNRLIKKGLQITLLFDFLKDKGKYQLLANVMEVCYHGNRDNALFNHSVETMVNIVPYIKNPELIQKLMKQLSSPEAFDVMNQLTNQADKVKFFKNLLDKSQCHVYRQLYDPNHVQKSFKLLKELFEYLSESNQKQFFKIFIQWVDNNENSTKFVEQCANQIVACLSNPHLSEAQRTPLLEMMNPNHYSKVLQHGSYFNEKFMSDYLKSTKGDLEKLKEMFVDMMKINKASEQLYYALGRAVTSLEINEQTELMVNSLEGNSENNLLVRASALIHLTNRGHGEPQARTLFEAIHERNPEQAILVANKITQLSQNYPEAFKQKLMQVVAVAPQLNTSSNSNIM